MSRRPDMQSDFLPHRDALRRLVRGIVRDESAVEDVTQEAWLTTLRHPPRKGWDPRGWLLGVGRHLALRRNRGEARRAEREQAAARPDAINPAAVRERIEATRRVMDALVELDDASQQVLTMRYLEDLPPRRIAKELEISVEAVKSRLKRALHRLRDRLDARHGGDRQRWLLALLPFAFPTPGLAATATAAVLQGATTMKTAIAAVTLIGAGTVIWIASDGSDRDRGRPAEPDPRRATSVAPAEPVVESHPITTSRHVQAPAETTSTRDDGPGSWGFGGRVLRHDEQPALGAQVTVETSIHVSDGAPGTPSTRTRRISTTVDDRGLYTIVLPAGAEADRLVVRINGHEITYREGLPTPPQPGQSAMFDVRLDPPCLVYGRMVDASRNPVKSMGVVLRADDGTRSLESALSLSQSNGRFFIDVPFAGAAELVFTPKLSPSAHGTSVAATRRATLVLAESASREGPAFWSPRRTRQANETWAASAPHVVTLGSSSRVDVGDVPVAAPGRIVAQVVDARSGEPQPLTELVVDCPIRDVRLSVVADEDGVATFPWPSGRHSVSFSVGRRGRTRRINVRVPSLGDGRVRVPINGPVEEPSEPVPEPAVKVGVATLRIDDPRGVPVERVELSFLSTQPVVYAGFRSSHGTLGDHEIDAVERGEGLSTLVIRSAHGFAVVDLSAGLPQGSVLDVTLRPASWIEGRLLTASGEPVPGALVAAGTDDVPLGLRHEYAWPGDGFGRTSLDAARTDAAGRFRILAATRDGIIVALTKDGGGALLRYDRATTVGDLTLSPRTVLEVKRGEDSPVDQWAHVVFSDPAVCLWVRRKWKAPAHGLEIRLPFPGRWSVEVGPELDQDGVWRGQRLKGRTTVRKGGASLRL